MKMYITCNPRKVGFSTGRQSLGAFLSEQRRDGKTKLDFISLVNGDDEKEFGYLTSETGDDISRFFESNGIQFGVKRLMEKEFIGAVDKFYVYNENDENSKTLAEYFLFHDIDITGIDLVECAKSYKKSLFKEITKRKFTDDNDSIANLAKSVMAISIWYDSMTTAQKTETDGYITRIKAMYDATESIKGLKEMTEYMEDVLASYYVAKTEIDNASTREDVYSVDYEG